MLKTKIKTEFLGKQYSVDLDNSPFNVIINTETSNNMFIDGVWQPEKGKMICLGLMFSSNTYIFIKEQDNDFDFDEEVKKVINNLKDQETFNFFAFNCNNEIGNIKNNTEICLDIKEIKPITKIWKRETFFERLYKYNILKKKANIPEPIKAPNSCISLWEQMINSKSTACLDMIREHCISSLVKESVLKKNRSILKENIEAEFDN